MADCSPTDQVWPLSACKAMEMAPPVDPETYLRLACERILLSSDNQNRQDFALVAAISRGFVASRQLDDALVRSVIEEYLTALALRANRHFFRHAHNPGTERTTLSAQRVVVGDFEVAGSAARLVIQRIVFADDRTHLDAIGVGAPPGTGSGSMRAGWLHGSGHRRTAQSPALQFRDDEGVSASGSIGSWGSSGGSWQGSFTTDVPLSPATAWIEVDGVRLTLPAPGPPPEVHRETVEPLEGIRGMLHCEIIAGRSRHSDNAAPEAVLDALAATGALAPDDLLAREAKDIMSALASGRATTRLAEPWKALLRRFPKTDGPVGHLPIGAAVELAGCSIRFDSLHTDESSFSVRLAVSPGYPLLHHHFPRLPIELSPIEWWAEDDRHNNYLGAGDGGSGSSEIAEGAIEFGAPLDPQARELRLLPTAGNQRVVVTMRLDGLEAPP
jgi:hypothetical protein